MLKIAYYLFKNSRSRNEIESESVNKLFRKYAKTINRKKLK